MNEYVVKLTREEIHALLELIDENVESVEPDVITARNKMLISKMDS